ncbi:MAG: hypothetical protein UT56_C0005G0045 [Candidatus Levybacteria bacterium GW2011_GWB1_39_7]|nr:MAG: hypothetical protein UT20_C0022G0003 [Candidatus Levybacteria bacterium GW2011_GWA1_39_11]KKR25000.1 MAG: hypothetical protein UT56_C0005G0045 [Candidatus Levybacteria bacterium GW2011_GWB1_39_7]KKR27557.1 MAG: hypothetical protein UT57_C0002G0029 [Microgenomates group bacterium GW2011_GWC1_39_7]
MSEVGEGTPTGPIRDNIQAAKEALQEGNEAPARETVRSISDELSHRIESDESSNDPLAYSLRMVAVNESYGLGSLTYLLEPPIGTEADRKIKMVYVIQGDNSYGNVKLLDNYLNADPYHKFAESRTRRVERMSERENLTLLEDIEKVYHDIAAHGIRKNPADFTAIHRGDPLSPAFDQYVKSRPFTGKLDFSSESQEPEPPIPESQKHQELTLESQEPQESTEYASLVQEAKDARKVAINARIEEGDSRRVLDLEKIAERTEITARERKMVEEEEEARPKIHEYLSKPGVKDVLRRFSDKFNQEVGTQYIYGMTSDGLVVAVRARCSEDVKSNDYYKAWVLDTKLSPDEIENSMISTSFHGINVSTVGNNADFPFNRGTATLLSDEEIKQRIFPPSNTQLIEFYKKTGGFSIRHTSIYSDAKPIYSIGGGRTLYPLDLA